MQGKRVDRSRAQAVSLRVYSYNPFQLSSSHNAVQWRKHCSLVLRSTAESGTGKGGGVSAVMEGKLKEKLESVGLALLCLAIDGGNPMDSWGKGERWKDEWR